MVKFTQPLDAELNEISFSNGTVTADLFSKHFNAAVDVVCKSLLGLPVAKASIMKGLG